MVVTTTPRRYLYSNVTAEKKHCSDVKYYSRCLQRFVIVCLLSASCYLCCFFSFSFIDLLSVDLFQVLTD